MAGLSSVCLLDGQKRSSRLADDPFFYGAGEKAAALDTNDSATFNGWGGRVNGQWSNLDGPAMTGTGGWVIARSHGKFVLGGNFTNFDGIAEADYIVNYDGSAYSALGSGFDGAVTALIVGADGSLYAGGGFTGSGATTLRGIGKWNGTAWAALGPPSSGGSVYTLLFDSSGNLWVGGDFTNWDGIANADYLVKWNGTAWSAIGTGANGVVWSLAQDASGTIYAAGSFTTINSVSCNRVAKWTGTTWATLGTGLDSTAYSMAIDDGGRVFVGGNHTTSGGVATNYISVWNGGAWEPLGDGLSGDVRGLAISPDGEVYAAGYFTNVSSTTYGVSAAIWNGSVWYPPDHISASASSTGRGFFWYGGDFYYAFYWGGTFNHSGKITISYTGTERAYPYIKIKRSGGTSASLQNITNAITKAQLLFNYSLANGEEVTITTTPGKQSIVSSLRGDINNELLPNSDFGNFYLTPGNAAAAQDNIITAFVDTAGSPTITASIIYRNVYISED
jgi:hypothetical protein